MVVVRPLLGRRGALGVLIALALAYAAPHRPEAGTAPEAVIETLVQHIVQLLESDELAREDATERLARTIGEDVDLDRLGRLVLGRHWRSADEAQQAEYLELFRQLMLSKFMSHLGVYSGKELDSASDLFTIEGSRPIGERDVIVDSVVRPPDRPPVRAAWRLRGDDGGWVIIDLIVENVSLLISQRAEFATVIERGGIDGLLGEMRERVATSRS